jgi:hypothetical protein
MTPKRSLRETALLLATALSACLATAADRTSSNDDARAAIRVFDLSTTERLGREIYRHDQLAWVATDVMLAAVDSQKLAKEGVAGWIVDVSGKAPIVRFVRKSEDAAEAAYDVSFREGAKPRLDTPEDRRLTQAQLAVYQASRAGAQALADRHLPWCGGSANTVVLPDPDGSGFLVYVLRPKPSADAVPIGGHYRITVSDDGKTIEQIDQLFASCLTVSNNRDIPKEAKPVGLVMSHVISDTPLETHVFLSLQEKLPFNVVTRDGQIWDIENGSIRKAGSVDKRN